MTSLFNVIESKKQISVRHSENKTCSTTRAQNTNDGNSNRVTNNNTNSNSNNNQTDFYCAYVSQDSDRFGIRRSVEMRSQYSGILFISIQKANLSPKNAFNFCEWMSDTKKIKKKKREMCVLWRTNAIRCGFFCWHHIHRQCTLAHRMGLNENFYIKFSVPPSSDLFRVCITFNPTDWKRMK